MSVWCVFISLVLMPFYRLTNRTVERIRRYSNSDGPKCQLNSVSQLSRKHYLTAGHLGIQDGSVRGELLAVGAARLPHPSEIADCRRTQNQHIDSQWNILSSFWLFGWRLSLGAILARPCGIAFLCCRNCQKILPLT